MAEVIRIAESASEVVTPALPQNVEAEAALLGALMIDNLLVEDVQLKPMVLTYIVPLAPEVDLGDYRALRLPFEPPAVTDESITERVEHLREHQAVVEPVERPAQLGDVATLDVKGFMNTGENPSDFLLADKDVALVLDEKADWPMAGFGTQVIGMAPGETRTFDLARDWMNQENMSEVLNFTRPDVIQEIHEAFLAVGCDAVETNTFGANKIVLA